jgi:hypothetical protein
MIVTINDAICSPERAGIGMQAGVEGGLICSWKSGISGPDC